MKRLVDVIGFKGAVAISGDCTKLRARLGYSNEFGSHVLGSVLSLSEVEVDQSEDLDEIFKKVKARKAMATQVRAILAKVIGFLSNTTTTIF